MKVPYKEEYQKYFFNMHSNGDIFAEYWRPFSYEEWMRNGRPIDDGGVKLDDNTEHLETFRYNVYPNVKEDGDDFLEKITY